MTPADLTLARRAVACADRWLPGMLTDTGLRVAAVCADGVRSNMLAWAAGGSRVLTYYLDPPLFAPDLTDPATLGCLLALVREAHGDPLIYTQPAEIEGVLCWLVWHGDSARAAATERPIAMGHTEPAALVAALEAACQE